MKYYDLSKIRLENLFKYCFQYLIINAIASLMLLLRRNLFTLCATALTENNYLIKLNIKRHVTISQNCYINITDTEFSHRC